MSPLEARSNSLFPLDARFNLWSEAVAPVQVLRRGALRYHHGFKSRFLDNDRTVVVYVPPTYNLRSNLRFPVLYMQDGQNLFDPNTAFGGVDWRADRTVERLAEDRHFCVPLIVGIYNTKARIDEYTPTYDRQRKLGGLAADYGRFLVEELKPFIDSHYRTLPYRATTGCAGSSLGGLLSLWLAGNYPAVFGFAAGLSPSLWWDQEILRRQWTECPSLATDTRIWLDIGTEEGGVAGEDGVRPAVRHVRALKEVLEEHLKPGHLRVLEVNGGRHDEHAWSSRFDQTLKFWLRPIH